MRTNVLKKSSTFPGVQHDYMEYTCDYCENNVVSDINGPKNWIRVVIKPEGYDYCSLSCAFKAIVKLICYTFIAMDDISQLIKDLVEEIIQSANDLETLAGQQKSSYFHFMGMAQAEESRKTLLKHKSLLEQITGVTQK